MERGTRSGRPDGRGGGWRLATRLIIALALPAVLCTALISLRVADALDRAADRDAAQRKTQLVFSVTVVAHALQNERDVAALASGRSTDDVRKHRAATDEALADFRTRAAAVGGGDRELSSRMTVVDEALTALPDIRAKAYGQEFSALRTQRAYEDIVTALLTLDTTLDFGDEQPMAEGWALHSLAIDKSALSSQRALVNAALVRGGLTAEEAAAVRELRGVRDRAQREFRTLDLGEDRAAYDRTVHDDAVAALLDRVLDGPAHGGGVTVQEWHRAASTVLDEIHEVETAAAQRLLNHAVEGRIAAEREAVTSAVVAAGALVLTLAAAAVMARTLVSRLKRLRKAALHIAEQQLPGLVRQISAQGGRRPAAVQAPSIDLAARDEVGDVARAFDAVFREAVKQTAEQAALRTSVNGMLIALAQRSQGLVYRQLEAISALENAEQEPEKLAGLFRVDHLATRIRRHGENLLVLAGEEPGRSRMESAPLVDVVRAAAAEVEQYTKISPVGIPEIALHGPAVHDVTHLLAELLENAAHFSGPGHRVEVTAAPVLCGRLSVQIHDTGVGIPPDRLEALNARLDSDLPVEVAVTRCMGLYVVSRLARKHCIRVRLLSGPHGTVAHVLLPARLLERRLPLSPAPVAAAPATTGTSGPATASAPPAAQRLPAAAPGHDRAASPAYRLTVSHTAAPSDAAAQSGAAAGSGSGSGPQRQAALSPSGLPVRVPMSSLRPGSAGAGPAQRLPAQGSGPGADELRRRASSFCSGAQRARDTHPTPTEETR